MIFKVTDNQYGQPHTSDSWASCWERHSVMVVNLTDVLFVFFCLQTVEFEKARRQHPTAK